MPAWTDSLLTRNSYATKAEMAALSPPPSVRVMIYVLDVNLWYEWVPGDLTPADGTNSVAPTNPSYVSSGRYLARSVYGLLEGDVSGSMSNTEVMAIRGRTVAGTVPSDGQQLRWDAESSSWAPSFAKTLENYDGFYNSVGVNTYGIDTISPTHRSRTRGGTALNCFVAEGYRFFGWKTSSTSTVTELIDVSSAIGNVYPEFGLQVVLDAVVRINGGTTAKIANVAWSVAYHSGSLTVANRVDTYLSGINPVTFYLYDATGGVLGFSLTPESSSAQSWTCRMRMLLTASAP